MTTKHAKHDILVAATWFLLSTIITWGFIVCGASLYHFDMQKMVLSCSVAGAKWGLQIVAAFLFLQQKRWIFIRGIGFTCFVGSCMLVPFCIGALFGARTGSGFLLSLILAVCSMLLLYYRAVRRSGISLYWYYSWVASLVIAITLQLTVVFHVF